MEHDVFISYSRKDKTIANQICEAFDKAGISYFIDRDGILSGQDFVNTIVKAIRESSIFLFLASKNSYASQITIDEVFEALDGVAKGDHQIITYIIDGSELPDELRFRLRRYNWRTKEEHPIESILVADIKKLLVKEYSADNSTEDVFTKDNDILIPEGAVLKYDPNTGKFVVAKDGDKDTILASDVYRGFA